MELDAYKEHVVRHEIGHWYVAKVLGFDVGEIRIYLKKMAQYESHEAHAHINIHPSLNKKEDISEYLVRRVSVLWAGVIFQSVSDKRSVEKILETDCISDHSKLRELCYILRGIRFSTDTKIENELDQINAIYDETWEKAKDIYNSNEAEIERLVKKVCSEIKEWNRNYEFNALRLQRWLSEDSSVEA
ncbi:hypothetical protein [Pseudoalteromonas sp. PB2-1]|uniref:hypothetical protein n=1 Tax=Pseudoalteromonas sp. PB2-1 TaxID=2907242 RepID=UPI00386876AD